MKMNKKYILYILIVVTVITNSRYAFASSILNKTYNIAPDAVGNGIDAVGKLSGEFPNKRAVSCTASMINTNNGNIGLTAGHCLFDPITKSYPVFMDFYPGYDRGQGNVGKGKVPVAKYAVLASLKVNNPVDDYGMFRLNYPGKLQSETGAFNLDFRPPPNIKTTVFGYPKGGGMSCNPRDAQTFCQWQGTSVKRVQFRTIPIDVGEGASGGPWIKDYAKNVNLGTIIGVSSLFVQSIGGSAAATWEENDFNAMLNYIQQ